MKKEFPRISSWVVPVIAGLLICSWALAGHSARAGLEVASARWFAAVNAQDVRALQALMTEDVELLDVNGTTVVGRDAAVRALREGAAHGPLVATSQEMSIANDLGWHVVALSLIQKDGIVHPRGQALEIWKRVDGEWKLHRQLSGGISEGVSLTKPAPNEPVLDRSRQ